MSETVQQVLSEVEFPSSWEPSHEILMSIFSFVTDAALSKDRYLRIENVSNFDTILSPEVVLWFWKNFPNRRHETVNRLIEWHQYTGWFNSTRGIRKDTKEVIKQITTTVFHKIPEDTTDLDLLGLKTRVWEIFSDSDPTLQIDFATKLMEASLAGEKNLYRFWYERGMSSCRDSNFYSLAWSKIERQRGYTDIRDSIISAASKCGDMPSVIIDDLVSGGHAKNKGNLVRVIIEKIDQANSKKERLKFDESLVQALNLQINEHKSILARFASCEDYYVQQKIIPYLRKEDLIFAAPIAAKLGLGNFLDRFMNPNSSEQVHRYRY